MNTRWKEVRGFPLYEVSNKGEVRRKSGRALKGWHDKDGYIRVHLVRFVKNQRKYKQVPVHTLVCEAFVGTRPSRQHSVAHGPRGRLFNHASHLRWATAKEQAKDRIAHGNGNQGEKHSGAKLTWKQVRYIRRVHVSRHPRFNASALARKFGVSHYAVYAVLNNISWKPV